MASLSRDPAFVQTLAEQFSQDASGPVDEIEIALADNSYERFRELAHALKGSSMMAGAVRLRDAAARAEKITDRNLGSVEDEVIHELRATLDATRNELAQLSSAPLAVRTAADG
jgi:HPt (histidine-containing phosphotransfer) domain-containing protein